MPQWSRPAALEKVGNGPFGQRVGHLFGDEHSFFGDSRVRHHVVERHLNVLVSEQVEQDLGGSDNT